MTDNMFGSPAGGPDLSRQILQALSGLGQRDPSAVNPATSQAMAQSRDTVTKLLQRQLSRIDSPFGGLSDVATAAETALMARKPFGQTMEDLDTNRTMKAAQIANTLSNVASREQRGGVDPIRAANLVARLTNDEAQKGNREATRLLSRVNSIAQNMDPQDALHFKTNWGRSISEYVQEHGRNPDINEREMLIDDFVRKQGYRFKAPNVQMQMDAFGRPVYHNPDPYAGSRGGTQPPAYTYGSTAQAPSRAPPIAAPDQPPAPIAREPGDPVITQRVPGRRPGASSQPTSPDGMELTPGTRSAENLKQRQEDVQYDTFKYVTNRIRTLVRSNEGRNFGFAGEAAKFISGVAAQASALSRSMTASEQSAATQMGADVAAEIARKAVSSGVMSMGPETAALQALLIDFSYMYNKMKDPVGTVRRDEMENTMRALGGGLLGNPAALERSLDELEAIIDNRYAYRKGMQPPGAPQAPTSGPRAGAVEEWEDGTTWRFNGGNPADQKSWTRVK